MFFPELIIPSTAPPEAQLASTEIDDSASDDENTGGEETTNIVEVAVADANAEPTEIDEGAQVASRPAAPTDQIGTTADSVASSWASVWIVGAGVATALVVLFGLTFVVLRPR